MARRLGIVRNEASGQGRRRSEAEHSQGPVRGTRYLAAAGVDHVCLMDSLFVSSPTVSRLPACLPALLFQLGRLTATHMATHIKRPVSPCALLKKLSAPQDSQEASHNSTTHSFSLSLSSAHCLSLYPHLSSLSSRHNIAIIALVSDI